MKEIVNLIQNKSQENNIKTDKENQPEQFQRELNQIKEKAISNGKLHYDKNGKFEYALAQNGEKSHLEEKQWLETRTTFFKQWFGDWERFDELKRKKERNSGEEEKELKILEQDVSKIMDENGEPLVVYHGTKREFDAFLDVPWKKFSGNYFAKEFEKVLSYAGLDLNYNGTNWKEIEKFQKEDYQNFLENVKQMMSQNKLEEIKGPIEFGYQSRKKDVMDLAQEFKKKYKNTIFFWMKKKYLDTFKMWMKVERKTKPIIVESYLNSKKTLVIDNKADGREGNWGRFESDVRYAKENGYDGVIWLRTHDSAGPEGTVLNVFNPKQIKSARKNKGLFSNESENIYD